MTEKWVKENPDLFKKNKKECLIDLKVNSNLKEEFTKYALMFKAVFVNFVVIE